MNNLSSPQEAAQSFMKKFFNGPKGNSPEAIKAKMLHWISVAQHPERHTDGDVSPHATNAMRRRARENARKLALKHPHIAQSLMADDKNQPEAV